MNKLIIFWQNKSHSLSNKSILSLIMIIIGPSDYDETKWYNGNNSNKIVIRNNNKYKITIT